MQEPRTPGSPAPAPKKRRRSLALALIGYIFMLIALFDLLEGFPLMIAGGVGVYTAGRMFASRYAKYLTWGLASMALGSAAMVILTLIGGIGGSTGRSMMWGVFVLPYPAGIILLLVTGGLLIREIRQAGRGTSTN